jgi:hypothetical protein
MDESGSMSTPEVREWDDQEPADDQITFGGPAWPVRSVTSKSAHTEKRGLLKLALGNLRYIVI